MGIQGSDLDNAGSRSDDARRLFAVPQRYTTQLRSQSEHCGSLTGSPLQPTSPQLLSRRSSRLFCTGSRQRRRRFPDHRRQIRQHQYHCQTAQELRSQNSWTRVHLRTRCQSRAQFVLEQRRTSPHSSFQCVASSSSPSLTTKFLLPLSLSLSTQFLLLSFGLGVFDRWVFLFFFARKSEIANPSVVFLRVWLLQWHGMWHALTLSIWRTRHPVVVYRSRPSTTPRLSHVWNAHAHAPPPIHHQQQQHRLLLLLTFWGIQTCRPVWIRKSSSFTTNSSNLKNPLSWSILPTVHELLQTFISSDFTLFVVLAASRDFDWHAPQLVFLLLLFLFFFSFLFLFISFLWLCFVVGSGTHDTLICQT